VTLPVEDAIVRLKAEVIAQDWRLSPKRVEQLEAAFASLREHFHGRKPTHAMLVMVTNVLEYIKTHGNSPPDTIDFLKEAMAHLVNHYEELVDDPAQEDQTFQALFRRFTSLKEKIQQKSVAPSPSMPTGQPPPPPLIQTGSDPQDDGSPLVVINLDRLLSEFKNGLCKAGPVGEALNALLEEWLLSPAVTALLQGVAGMGAALERKFSVPDEQYTPCPPTPVRIITINGLSVAIQSSVIALIRPVTRAKAQIYAQEATVPLKDFSRFMRRLSRQFSSSLSLVKERTLMELCLPIMTAEGQEFHEVAPAAFTTLVVISNGNWHGALACDAILAAEQCMIKFAKQPNGDLVGTAWLEDGGRIPLLDPVSMLRREGILLMR
jgi:hypothetical protein